ncbi:MFS transporter [Kordiimonas gwangyangensis]|uniref:MFS transporter n=1 Tax=Kordiimonas gwangyangensis TaxID=288022 RepID=UPI00138DD136|nr:MFS transporter [Kordiimonas gwangyangensis]
MATTGNRRKLGARHIIYGLPAACFAFPLVPFAVYLPSFYATDMALGFLVVAIALFLSRLVDMISDPLVGMWSDDTGNAWWHRKGWIVAGAVIAAIALVFLCRPPAQPSALYLGLWSAILYIGWTMVMVPYQPGAANSRKTMVRSPPIPPRARDVRSSVCLQRSACPCFGMDRSCRPSQIFCYRLVL